MIADRMQEDRRCSNSVAIFLLCAASTIAAAQAHPETFVIQAGQSGREATIKIPVGAVTTFSANAAEALVGYADPQVEAMRLSGDVLINVIGASQPIQIRADTVVLELTADEAPVSGFLARAVEQLRSTEIIVGSDDTQTFVGNVFFTVQTLAGAMQITADRVEHKMGPAARRLARRGTDHAIERRRCLCGAVRYRCWGADVLHHLSLHHLPPGQRRAPVAWVTSTAASSKFSRASRPPFVPRRASSRRFCGVCGTALTYENDKRSDDIDITTASLDDPNRFPPTAEVWVEHKLSWALTDAAWPSVRRVRSMRSAAAAPPRGDTHNSVAAIQR